MGKERTIVEDQIKKNIDCLTNKNGTNDDMKTVLLGLIAMELGSIVDELKNLKIPNKELIYKQDAIETLKIWEDNYYWDESCRSGELEDITSPHSMIEKLYPYEGEERGVIR